MSIKEQIAKSIDTLSESELHQVAEYLSFLKFRSRHHKSKIDEEELGAIYREFADEDREVAEEGLEDYNKELDAEDSN